MWVGCGWTVGSIYRLVRRDEENVMGWRSLINGSVSYERYTLSQISP